MDYLQMMEHMSHLVAHMNDPQKEFLYLDSALDFCKVDAANLGCKKVKWHVGQQLSIGSLG